MQEIENLRAEINKIDTHIIDLLSRRANCAKKIGQEKLKNNLPIKSEQREKEIFKKLEDQYQKNIYKTILQESRKLQQSPE